MKINLKIHSGKLELELQDEVEGSIFENLDQIRNLIKSISDNGLLLQEITKIDEDIDQAEIQIEKIREKEELPLDLFLQKYDAIDSQPQKRTLAVGLYLTEVKGKDEFKSKEINEILNENRLSTIESIATHAKRLRKKGLVSMKSDGKEIVMKIYNNKIKEINDFLKKEN
ncbi:MAG: hypothetical protein ACXADY_16775 [Candidatus Hodarchaeales archaeon]